MFSSQYSCDDLAMSRNEIKHLANEPIHEPHEGYQYRHDTMKQHKAILTWIATARLG